MKAIGLSQIFHIYRKKILLTYSLFTIEFLLFLAGPFVLGAAIDSLLHGSYTGIGLFIAQHLGHLAVSRVRRLYNIRVFTAIYNEVVVDVINKQKGSNTDSSRIIARANLAKDLINFFENDITSVFNSVYSVLGSLIILGWYDIGLFSSCLFLIVPSVCLNYYFNKKNRIFYDKKNSELERQVKILQTEPIGKIKQHYKLLAKWDIKLSDISALNFTLMEFFVLGLIVFALIYYCGKHQGASSGTILAVFQYLVKFIVGLDYVPILNSQLANIRDIQKRMQSVDSVEESVPHVAN